MPKKLSELVPEVPESQLSGKIRESANQIWLAGLGAFAKAQAEGLKMFETLVAEGEKVQARTRETADERIAEVREKATGAWDKLEKVFEERVAELTEIAKKLGEDETHPRRKTARDAA